MTSGATTTIRGGESLLSTQSRVIAHNATTEQLQQARQAIGRYAKAPLERYRIADIRLDSLHRLIVDLVLE
jgi:hypothetical protein